MTVQSQNRIETMFPMLRDDAKYAIQDLIESTILQSLIIFYVSYSTDRYM